MQQIAVQLRRIAKSSGRLPLLELAIALVFIGLIIGGTLVARVMIRNADANAVAA